MKAFFAKPGMPSWEEAWFAIEAEFGNPACEDDETGEVWQYVNDPTLT